MKKRVKKVLEQEKKQLRTKSRNDHLGTLTPVQLADLSMRNLMVRRLSLQ